MTEKEAQIDVWGSHSVSYLCHRPSRRTGISALQIYIYIFAFYTLLGGAGIISAPPRRLVTLAAFGGDGRISVPTPENFTD